MSDINATCRACGRAPGLECRVHFVENIARLERELATTRGAWGEAIALLKRATPAQPTRAELAEEVWRERAREIRAEVWEEAANLATTVCGCHQRIRARAARERKP